MFKLFLIELLIVFLVFRFGFGDNLYFRIFRFFLTELYAKGDGAGTHSDMSRLFGGFLDAFFRFS